MIQKGGENKTSYFLRGAQETLELAKIISVKNAVLKSKSLPVALEKFPTAAFPEN